MSHINKQENYDFTMRSLRLATGTNEMYFMEASQKVELLLGINPSCPSDIITWTVTSSSAYKVSTPATSG